MINDRRKVNAFGTASSAAAPAAEGAAPAGGTSDDPAVSTAEDASAAELLAAEAMVAERTEALQRLQAEYANYRKRVDRDRVLLGELAAGKVLEALLPVLDDIERAQQHGDVTGAFKSVADKLVTTLERFELQAFGEAGDPFDPSLHEAVTHEESDDVEVPTASLIMRRGYRQGERVVRPAMVGVTAPSTPIVVPSAESSDSPSSDG